MKKDPENDFEKMRLITEFLKKRYTTRHYLMRNKFRLLITTILSQRTRDETTEDVSRKLFSVAKTPEQMLELSKKRLEHLIRSAGPYRQKADRIRKVCQILIEKYDGNVPRTRTELLELPGVGFKTADIVLSYGFGIPTIAVDTHVNRIPKRIGIVPDSAGVEEVRNILERLTPEKDRFVVNLGMVRFGQQVCRPVNPKCPPCPFNYFCKYGKKRLQGD